jgi:hypothetical protein
MQDGTSAQGGPGQALLRLWYREASETGEAGGPKAKMQISGVGTGAIPCTKNSRLDQGLEVRRGRCRYSRCIASSLIEPGGSSLHQA